MTKEEFEVQFAEAYSLTSAEYHAAYMTIQCDCGEDCGDWIALEI